MQLATVLSSVLGTNTYILYEGTEALVIDPGMWSDVVLRKLDELGVVCQKVVLTHGHYDHAAAAADLEDRGAKVLVYVTEEALNNPIDSLAASFNVAYRPYRPEILLHDGDNIPFSGATFRVMHTPGHTPGGICLIGDGKIFSGDTLFCEDVGRTDFPGGSARDLKRSIDRLFALDGNYDVYPGHGAPTTLDWERKHNPFA